MPFIANSTYYFDIFFEDKNLSYDVYYSETNPTDLDLSNPTYLKKIINLLRISLFKRSFTTKWLFVNKRTNPLIIQI